MAGAAKKIPRKEVSSGPNHRTTLTTAQGLRRFDSIDKIDNSMQ